MKNVIRIFLLLALVVLASKVLFSDFHLPSSENKTLTVTATK